MALLDFLPTPLHGLVLVQRKISEDERGWLSRLYCADEFIELGIEWHIAQVNHTLTRSRGAVRGLHFQYPPHADAKLVSCIRGEVFDVAVDLRRDSSTFLRWHGVVLTASKRQSLLVPEGFAHGFQALSEDCELIYLHTAAYHPESEGALNVADPRLGIVWPLATTQISDRDRNQALIEPGFQGIAP